MRDGAWVESVIVWTVRVAMAILMIPVILLYAAVACVAWIVAGAVRTADVPPASIRVPA
jgi:hypothetical protein